MKTVTRILYTISELKEQFPKIYKKVLDDHRDWNTDCDWWNFTYYDIKTLLGYCGFTEPEIAFSGFSSQGDGASFTGTCYYRDIDVIKLTEYAPNEEKFRLFATDLKNLMKDYPDSRVKLSRAGHRYVHENSIDYDLEYEGEVSRAGKTTDDIKLACQVIMREIYRRLEEEYDDLRSDERIHEALETNEHYFDETGRAE